MTDTTLNPRPDLSHAWRALLALAVAGALGLAALLPAGVARADDAKAREIMQKVNDRNDGDNETSRMQMILIDKNGNRREREIEAFRKDVGKDTTYSLMFFLSPADVKGTGFLTYDYTGKDDDQWLYLPALHKTKRIASTDKSGAFMGSDFNYSDMTKPDLDKYDFTLVKEEEVDGHKTWRIQAIPRTDATKDETGYDKSVLWVREDNFVVVRGVRWVQKSPRLKFMEARKLERIDGIWVVTERSMVTREGNTTVHATLLRSQDVKFNQALDKDLFTIRRLEKGP